MARSKYEKRAEDELKAKGWIVDNKCGMSRWSKNRDFWNCFDLVCRKKGRNYLRWISIKGTMGIISEHIKQIKECWLPRGNRKEIWSRSRSLKRYWNKKIIKR